MISTNDAISIHEVLIAKFGGSRGLRDRGALEASLARPYATFGGEELYPSNIDKAAALMESILINHPFIDGNKRIAYVLMRLTLMQPAVGSPQFDLKATQEEKYDMVIAATTGVLRYEGIKAWINKHVIQVEK